MNRLITLLLLVTGCASLALASTAPVPEIDASSAASALVLLSGAVLVFRSRRK